MDSLGVKDRTVAVFGGITVALYLAAFALTPTHAPNSGSAGIQIVHWAAAHSTQLLASYLMLALGWRC